MHNLANISGDSIYYSSVKLGFSGYSLFSALIISIIPYSGVNYLNSSSLHLDLNPSYTLLNTGSVVAPTNTIFSCSIKERRFACYVLDNV